MHLAIAIPTFNRLTYLQKNIDILLNQKIDSNIKISICISNTASTDETYDYLKKLCKSQSSVKICNKKYENQLLNLEGLASIIPNDADWIWYLGDDDMLTSMNAINKIIEIIKKNDIEFLHITQQRRSYRNGKFLIDTIENLCNFFGYLEVLGWISSLIVKKDIFLKCILETHSRAQKDWDTFSAFNHSYYFYKELYKRKCAIYDGGLVDPQDLKQTDQSIERWKKDNIPEKYLYIALDIINLKKSGFLPQSTKHNFFRYQNINIWDRWIIYLVNETIRSDISDNIKLGNLFLKKFDFFWNLLINFSEVIDDEVSKKILINNFKTVMGICIKYLFEKNNRSIYQPFLVDQIMLAKKSCFDFKTII